MCEKLLTSFLLLIILFNCSNQEYIYTPEEVFDYFNDQIFSKEKYHEIIQNIINILKEVYIFDEIIKNPPQPDFDKTYFPVVDFEQKLNEINYNNISIYKFYQSIQEILSSFKDPGIQLNWNITALNNFYFMQPLDFYVKTINNQNKIFGKCNIDKNIMSHFLNGSSSTFEIIEKNTDVAISAINGFEPFDFIRNFGNNYMAIKSMHGTFTYKIKYHNQLKLKYYPLKYDDFKNFRITYENGDHFLTDYIFVSNIDIYENSTNITSEEEEFNNYLNEISINNYKSNFPKKFNEIKDEYYKIKNNISIDYDIDEINWKYKYENILRCITDFDKNVNIYHFKSFSPEDENKYIETINQCVNYFDENDYPIIVINEMNEGGENLFLVQYLIGIISPFIPINIYGKIKLSNSSLKKHADFLNFIKNFINVNTCKSCVYSDLFDNNTSIDDNITSNIFSLTSKEILIKIEEIRSEMKNKRNPNKIIIYTDGYTFSTSSLFIKYLQYYGGAIIVGYSGNGKYQYKFFESAVSPTPFFSQKIIKIFSSASNNILKNNYNFEFTSIPGIQTFLSLNENEIPLEYNITSVDEKVSIFESLDKNNYYLFVDEANKIIEKYNSECNINNKNIIKFSEECILNQIETNENIYGGYECGEDGNWTNNCVYGYCENGHIYDNNLKKCVKHICFEKETIEEEEEEEKKNDVEDEEEKNKILLTNIIIFFYTVFILLLISILLCYKYKTCCFNNNTNIREELEEIKHDALVERMINH